MKKPNFVWAPQERLKVIWSLNEWQHDRHTINSSVDLERKQQAMSETWPNPKVWRSKAKIR